MLRLGHQDLLDSAAPGGQALQGQAGAAGREGHHLQVEVVTAQNPPVQGGELHHDLLAEAQRPTRVQEQAAQVLRLKGSDKKRQPIRKGNQ